jgi:hypothetical protein
MTANMVMTTFDILMMLKISALFSLRSRAKGIAVNASIATMAANILI